MWRDAKRVHAGIVFKKVKLTKRGIYAMVVLKKNPID